MDVRKGKTGGLRDVYSLEKPFLSILVPSTLLCQGPCPLLAHST